jgi:S-adenosylmethionine hydrolase
MPSAPPARPLVALLTDFGLRDHYVGAMKGVILGICPEATLVDISHDVPPQDVLAAALELSAAYRFFPPGTIFLVVVDPGVGSVRRGLAAEAGPYRFVAPDNGVLSPVFDDLAPTLVVALDRPEASASAMSRTFEGRDRFAPAAGRLAAGADVRDLGRPAGEVQRLDVPRPRATEEGIDGAVVRVDRFGNLITNIDRRLFEALGSGRRSVRIGPHRISKMVGTYAEALPGEVCVLFSSSDHLEIAVNGSNASRALGVGRGTGVRVVGSA